MQLRAQQFADEVKQHRERYRSIQKEEKRLREEWTQLIYSRDNPIKDPVKKKVRTYRSPKRTRPRHCEIPPAKEEPQNDRSLSNKRKKNLKKVTIKDQKQSEESQQLQKAIDSIANIKIIPSKHELEVTGEPTEFLEKHKTQDGKVNPEPFVAEDDGFSDDEVLELVDGSSEKINPIESQPTPEAKENYKAEN